MLTQIEASILMDQLAVPGLLAAFVPESVLDRLGPGDPEARRVVEHLLERWSALAPWPLYATLDALGVDPLRDATDRAHDHWDAIVDLVVAGRDPAALHAWLVTLGPDWAADPAGRTSVQLAQAALESAGDAGHTIEALLDGLEALGTVDPARVDRVREAFGPGTSTSVDPFETLTITGTRAFVDRGSVRELFRAVVNETLDVRVLVVNSQRRGRIGKTYTRDYLAFLAEELGLGLGGLEIRPEESGSFWTPAEIAGELVEEFGGDRDDLPERRHMMPGRWYERLAKKVLRTIPSDRQTWIYLDRLSAELVPPETFQFVMHLGSLILRAGPFAHVRLLLVDYPRVPLEAELDSENAWRKLVLEPLSREHVVEYLQRCGVAEPDAAARRALAPLGEHPWDPFALRRSIEKELA